MSAERNVRVAIYLRVSTNEQAKKFGLKTQLRQIKDYIERNRDKGYVFDERFVYQDDGYSGALSAENRPALKRLMDDAKAGKFKVAIVYKLDRYFRSMQLLLNGLSILQEYGVTFLSVSEQFDTGPFGKVVLHLFGMLAEFERSLILERTKEGKISAAKAGRYVGGAVPLGYKVLQREDNAKILTVDAEESRIVKDIFYWFVEMDYSALEIARTLTKRKVLTNKDKSHKGKYRKVNPIGKWNETTIRNKLKDEHYIGKYYYNKSDSSGRKKHMDEWVVMECPKIIDEETFEKAQRKLVENDGRRGNNRKYEYLFSGKIRCGMCNSSYTGYMSSKKTKNYRCLKTNKSKVVKVCKAKHISEKLLDEAIWPIVSRLFENPESIIRKLERDTKKESQQRFYRSQKSLLEDKLSALKKSRSILLSLKVRDKVSDQEFDEESEILENERLQFEEELADIKSMLNSDELKKQKIASVKELLEKYQKNYKSLTQSDRKDIYQDIIGKILVEDDNIRLQLKVPKSEQEKFIKSNSQYGGADGIRTHEMPVLQTGALSHFATAPRLN